MYELVIIGNGPSATSWKAGKLIDSCKKIVRINNYQIAKYEEYVGTRTDIWVKNDTKGIIKRDHTETLTVCRPDRANGVDMTPARYHGGWESTGLVAIKHFIKSHRPILIHGFDNFKSDIHHYFQSSSSNIYHNPCVEQRIINRLINQHKVIDNTHFFTSSLLTATAIGQYTQTQYSDIQYYASTSKNSCYIGKDIGIFGILADTMTFNRGKMTINKGIDKDADLIIVDDDKIFLNLIKSQDTSITANFLNLSPKTNDAHRLDSGLAIWKAQQCQMM